ncbi:MAG TPA: FG-GAP-like repeat-containing protein [Candidatus Saccharimonadia bacterium]|nr:FG-GAP-like repeat-containing protein [Candidatus Saccharimonadia bacterium]
MRATSQWFRQKLRRLVPLLAVLGLLTGGIATIQVTTSGPAQAAAMGNGWTSPLASMANPADGFLADGCGHANNYLKGQFHIGADFWGSSGDAVYALGDGTVRKSQSFGEGTYVVMVQHTAPDGSVFVAVYGHLNDAGRPGVGAVVHAGDQIGTLNPSAANGPHLHLGVLPGTAIPSNNWGNMSCPTTWPPTNKNGFVDPMPYLNAHPVSGGGTVTDTDGDGVPDNQDVALNTPGPVTNRGIPDYSARTTGDFNGDGKQDIAAFYDYGSGETQLWVFTGNGDGTFTPPSAAVWDSGGQWNWNQTKVVTGDFNGDGKSDVAAFYYFGGNETKLYVFYGSSSGLAGPTLAWDSNGGLNWDAAKFVSGDFNGDGKQDIAMLYGYGGNQVKIFVFYGSTSGPTTPTQVWDSGPGSLDWNAIKVVAGNFNGDTYGDIAMLYGYGTTETKIFEFLGTSTGFGSPFIAGDYAWSWNSLLPVTGDFNGDGKSDVGVFYGYLGQEVKLFELLGTSTGFAAPTQVWDSGPNNWDWNVLKPVTGDFNGDGKSDVGVFYGLYNSRTTLNEFLGSSTGVTVVSSAVWDSGPNSWNWANILIG